MLSSKSLDLIDTLGEEPRYARDLTSVMSSRTLFEKLEELENAGFIEKYVEKEGRGRPRHYYRLTPAGRILRRKLIETRDDLLFLSCINSLKRQEIPVTAGVSTSLTDFYGAPLVLTQLDIIVPKASRGEARKIVDVQKKRASKRGWLPSSIEWGVDIAPIPWRNFEKRAVKVNGVPYLSVEDLIILTLHRNEARLISCLPRVVHEKSQTINHDYLLELAKDFNLVGRTGALLDMTNRLAGEEITQPSTLKNFERLTPKRKIESPRSRQPLVKKGIVPLKEDPVDVGIRERWHVVFPTFREVREIWELT
ncbi:hypothetical protein AKJ48_03920 [candidate division MSBL1 archaeon SCGC-AAA261O19]|uniref:Transcription regulator PadR N-terminal domain-containing protein n=2 Tax=candidate division MSBL1 TaxID=215777 RepID=A0A133V0I8_9EURY|nr:hypothetical protein AKJ42_02085 [candidate division MSBL1 archaeon SCGC-AAA261C02]KXB03406.1 hypothetical protein AKJ48_03920 [candidate division MSBL1 archaeon SCGC-AAA261O19]